MKNSLNRVLIIYFFLRSRARRGSYEKFHNSKALKYIIKNNHQNVAQVFISNLIFFFPLKESLFKNYLLQKSSNIYPLHL